MNETIEDRFNKEMLELQRKFFLEALTQVVLSVKVHFKGGEFLINRPKFYRGIFENDLYYVANTSYRVAFSIANLKEIKSHAVGLILVIQALTVEKLR